jgi:AraC-like DNA-binding protein
MENPTPTASCTAMAVSYFARIREAWRSPASGELDIIVPCGKADALIISLNRVYFADTASEELGGPAPVLAARWSSGDALLVGIAHSIGGGFRSGRVPSQALLTSVAVCIAIHLSRHCEGGASGRGVSAGLVPRKLEEVRSFIEHHLAEPLLVEQLAAVVHMSPFHFARLFKAATGSSPHAYVTTRRVEHAKELLRAGNLPLVEVGAAVGFQTQGHFTEVFHRLAGITPRRFRLANGRNPVYGRKDAEELQQARV